MKILLFGIIIILSGGLVSAFLPEKRKASAIILFTSIGAALTSFFSVKVLISGLALSAVVNFSPPIGTAVFRADAISAFFILLISIMSVLSVIYAKGYMSNYEGTHRPFTSHFIFIPLLIVSMMMVTVAGHVIIFLIMWEIMSLSSFFLMIYVIF